MPVPIPERLSALVADDAEDVDLAEAALLVAMSRYPELDVAHYLGEIESMTEAVRVTVPVDAPPRDVLAAINDHLFGRLGYGPEVDQYYDPCNSYLNDVIDRRRGIPITLSVLYIQVARALGLEIDGISFPGHFLVKCQVEQGVVVIDPYHRGVSLSLDELRERLRTTQNSEVSGDALVDLLESATPRDIVARMLRNLKAIYIKSKQAEDALTVIEWLVHLVPNIPQEIRDRGLVYEQLECFRAALADFDAYLRAVPDAADVDAIRERVLEMRKATARLN